ncbi:MAG: aminotransferase class V-fold PLP-dependent enzyme, partial [Acidobacteriota bacterium]
MAVIYLDNNATTQVAPEVVEAMAPFFTDQYFNPSSMYEAARGPADAISDARKTIAKLLGRAKPSEILFTSCASESNNTAIFGTIAANPERKHLIT